MQSSARRKTEMTLLEMATPEVIVLEATALEVTAQISTGGLEVLERYREAWESLCAESGCPPFYRPEWIATYLKAFEPDSEVVLLTAHAGEKFVGVLPMVQKKGWYAGVPVNNLCGAGNAHSVRFGLLRCPGKAGDAAMAAIWELIKQTPGWDVVEIPMFAENGTCEKLIELARQEGYRTLTFLVQESPVLHMTHDSNKKLTWLGGTTRHFRHELRRYGRHLEERNEGEPKLLQFKDPYPVAMEEFYELEAAGWKGDEGTAIQCDPATRTFYQLLAEEAALRGYFCLYSLDLDGRMIAGSYTVRSQDCMYPMKITYDERLKRCAPGQLLLNGILQDCASRNIPELFFGGSKDRYKLGWTPDTVAHYDSVIFAPGVRSQIAFHIRTQVLCRLGKWSREFQEWRRNRRKKETHSVVHSS
jgi:CelD/BcsL family acetyltransferase involved in cellulose biosynthesis